MGSSGAAHEDNGLPLDAAGGGKECQTPTTMKGFEVTRVATAARKASSERATSRRLRTTTDPMGGVFRPRGSYE